MKKLIFLFSGVMMMSVSTGFSAVYSDQDGFYSDIDQIPLLVPVESQWEKIENVAHYKEADWSNVVGRAENILPWEAFQIAERDPEITYFFYVKGYQMALENLNVEPAIWRVFQNGDAVFFKGEPWWGTAEGLADGYVKKNKSS